MIRRWRRGLVLATVAAAVVAGVLLTAQPWSGDEATAGTVQYRICDVVLDGPVEQGTPAQDFVMIGRGFATPSGVGREPWLDISVVGPFITDPETKEVSGGRSVVSIDPGTGAVLDERYADASHQTLVQSILATVRVEPLDPSTASWPYTNAAQMPPQREERETFKYRLPDPGSGLVVSYIYGDGNRFFYHTLKVTSCRSEAEISVTFRQGAEPEVTATEDLHPDDEAAFQTFLHEVEVKGVGR